MTGYKWHEVYRAALLETDWSKIEERIERRRLRYTKGSTSSIWTTAERPEENQAIEDALTGLSVLRNEAARWREKRVS